MTKDQKIDYLEVRGWEKVQRTHQHKPLVFKDPTGEVTEPQRLERAFEIQQEREDNGDE